MPVVSKQEFLENLADSGAATHELITLWTANVSADATAIKLAKSLVDNDHLTEWQAKFLLSGQKKLKFGNYLLQQRTERNDIGDYFVAKQLKLDRLVKIVFLNKALSALLSKRKELLRMVAATTDIEHEGIEHVHVVDQAAGRYMLITDYIDDPTLNDPELLSKLESDDLSRLLTQILEVVSIAHKHGISHGALTESDLAVGDRSKLTLKNIAASFLVHNAARDTPEAMNKVDEDRQAVVKIARKLVKRLGSDDDERVPKIMDIIGKLEKKQLDIEQAGTSIKDLYPSSTLPKFRKHSTISSEVEPELRESRKEVEAVAAEPYPEDRFPDDSMDIDRGAIWHRRIMQLAGALTALGLVVYLATSGWFGGGEVEDDNRRSISSSSENQELPSLASMNKMPDRIPDAEFKAGDADPINRNLEKERRFGSIEIPPSETEPTSSSADDALAGGNTDVANSGSVVDDVEQPEEMEPAPSDSILGAFESLNSDSATTNSDADGSESSAEVANSESALTAEITDDFPTDFNLPDVSDTRPVVLAKLTAERVDLQLISDPDTSKSKSYFEVKGNQAFDWSVDLRVGRTSGPLPVGTIAVDDNNLLTFSWNGEAVNLREAPFLANSILRVSDGQSSKFIGLRKPLAIKGFRLRRDEPQVRIDLDDLKFLPENAKVELLSLDEKEYGTVYFGERADNTFSRKNPLIVNFRELPEYQLLFLWLAADFKKRSRLEASLQLQFDPESRSRLATEKTVEAAKKFLDNSIFEIKQNHDYLKNVKIAEHRKRYNLSKEKYKDEQRREDVKQLKEQLDLSESRFQAFREIQTQLESFYDKPLPVTIYFNVWDRRVILATTVPE